MFDSGGSNKYINFLTSTQLFLKFNLTYNFKVKNFSRAFTLLQRAAQTQARSWLGFNA